MEKTILCLVQTIAQGDLKQFVFHKMDKWITWSDTLSSISVYWAVVESDYGILKLLAALFCINRDNTSEIVSSHYFHRPFFVSGLMFCRKCWLYLDRAVLLTKTKSRGFIKKNVIVYSSSCQSEILNEMPRQHFTISFLFQCE